MLITHHHVVVSYSDGEVAPGGVGVAVWSFRLESGCEGGYVCGDPTMLERLLEAPAVIFCCPDPRPC